MSTRMKSLPITVSASPSAGGTISVVLDTRHRPMSVAYDDGDLAAILRVLDDDKFWYYLDLWFGQWEEWSQAIGKGGIISVVLDTRHRPMHVANVFPRSTAAHAVVYEALTAWLNDIWDEQAVAHFERRDAGD